MSESRQHWLDRNRPPRVQITYDVETLGASAKQEIPFVAGIIGDFAGTAVPDAPLSGRRFVDIDRDNFDKVMTALKATLSLAGKQLPTPVKQGESFKVDMNTTTPVQASLSFGKLDDFGPQAILKQLAVSNPALQQMLEDRQRLSELLVKVQADEGYTATLTSPQVLDETFKALNDASVQVTDTTGANTATVAATLAKFANGATDPKSFDTAKFEGDEGRIVDAMLAVVVQATAASTTAFTEATNANGTRITKETAGRAEGATDTQRSEMRDAQEAAARAFQRSSAAFMAVYHAADDAAARLQSAPQSIIIPDVTESDNNGATKAANKAALELRDTAAKLAGEARTAVNALDTKVRRADSLVRSAVSQYVRS